ncbi:hypothetical protein FHT40_001720 [Mycolicibacterium sp. BK556]|uniref:hypothetical protein n=1 Tax=unclassified Mycolicibacterium TaxID=2636767 RepID=UPI00160B595D|nr:MULTISPECIES: hypothetical protein [unclassified Mycolicibacterium]MBB3602087.1 hypothetical protein [Mycolicibacterium sp. BK556]MBB3631839.1 hypothetical protein [Mycolicibacterium sp. BK607]MBB3749843.1 hypothetical protein [Mycolicibacterium sp. BK634]
MASSRQNRSAVNKIFGTELPQESSDERDPDDTRDTADREQWFRDNVPPHHH